MKKLLLILSAVFVSVMAYSNAKDPYTLNPYAYDLWSNWDPTTQKLTLRFKVNSVPNLVSINDWGIGIQVFAVDGRGTKYYIWGTPGDVIRAAHDGGAGAYEYTADLSSGLDLNGNLIPRNEDLTWMVRVAGRGNGDATKVTPEGTISNTGIDYTRVRYWWSSSHAFHSKRLIPQSIAINTNPESLNFGRVLVADNNNHNTTWYSSWGNGTNRGRGIYAIEPDFLTISNGGKRASLNNSIEYGGFASDQKEPRGICVSDDGRIFVSSYSNNSTVAVWEVTNTNNYASAANKSAYASNTLTLSSLTTVLEKSEISNYRVISLDVKGTGDDMKLLLLCCSTSAKKVAACYEYNVSTGDLTSIPLHNDIKNYEYEDDYINIHAKIAYGKNKQDQKIDNVIWISFASTAKNESRLYAVDRTGNILENEKFGDRSAGEGFYIKGDMLLKSFRTLKNSTGTENEDYPAGFYIKKIGDDNYTIGGNYYANNSYIWVNELLDASIIDTKPITARLSSRVINDFAVDYANNAYLACIWSGRNFPVSLPYSGRCETTAPSRYKFKLQTAHPNILATDLKYEPEGTTDKYTFSFITNTKPTEAEIRFYKKAKRGNMDRNIATIHADNYDETQHATIEPDYVYTFQRDELKQGLMKKTFKMVGGEENTKELTDALPPGEMYWSVYVKTDKSTCFAPIYRSGYYPQDSKYEPLHAVVNNYPATDMFGQLIVTNNNDYTENRPNNGLLIYGLNPSDAEQKKDGVNTTRFIKRTDYLNGDKGKNGLTFLTYPRRMAITSDGKVYIADEGQCSVDDYAAATTVAYHNYGGVKIWDPASPNEFKLFSDNKIGTSTSVALWNGKLYATNTYEEYLKHISNGDDGSASNYTKSQQYVNGVFGWNGFVEYNLDAYYNTPNNGTWNDFWKSNSRATEVALGRGDESGNITLVPMEKGIWLCQSREDNWIVKKERKQPLADNLGSYLLSFVPFSRTTTTNEYGPRTWRSCTTDGIKNFTTTRDPDNPSELTQKENSLLQSTPGAGMAYRKVNGVEYLYIVNHEGNILQMQIEWQNNTTPLIHTSKITKLKTAATFKYDKLENNWNDYSFITSMDFDYAGNLVTVTGDRITHHNKKHEIVIYTMPYDRTNAQEIRAPESCIYIPERLHQMAMEEVDIQGVLDRHTSDGACAVDLYRPLQGEMFNTFCVPFALPMNHENNPLAGSEVRQFTGATIESIGGEKILCLKFAKVSTILCNVPYIIKPQQNIKQIMRFNWPVTLAESTEVKPIDSDKFDTDNMITYQGLLPKTDVNARYDQTTNLPLRLILVADNRLAVLTGDGEMYGFRGYFDLAKPLPPGTVAKISAKKDTPTNTTIVVDGKKVNIDKYLREGRVYIRVGDSLYTVDGQLVE